MSVFGARVYLNSDNETVAVYQSELAKGSHEYVPRLLTVRLANINDPQEIGKLVKDALTKRIAVKKPSKTKTAKKS